jgi:HPt (histidine-containing phosphotransfer) domain-containing protein
MTAHAMTGDREKSLQTGMVDHVAKPIDPDQLFTTLQKWIHPLSNQGAIESSDNGKGTVPEDALAAEQVKTDDDLPETLQGFDIEQGLKRMQGNRKLYRKLLLDFASNYGNAADEIHQALTAGDINQVHSLVHNIKGLAGNLSATGLQNAATAMDSSVKKALSGGKQVPGDLDSIFAEMKAALEQALASCQTLEGSDDKKAGTTTVGPSVILPSDLARETAEQLQTAADMGDITNLKSIAEGLRSKSASYGIFSDKITRMAEDFDFEGILKLVDELNAQA